MRTALICSRLWQRIATYQCMLSQTVAVRDFRWDNSTFIYVECSHLILENVSFKVYVKCSQINTGDCMLQSTVMLLVNYFHLYVFWDAQKHSWRGISKMLQNLSEVFWSPKIYHSFVGDFATVFCHYIINHYALCHFWLL